MFSVSRMYEDQQREMRMARENAEKRGYENGYEKGLENGRTDGLAQGLEQGLAQGIEQGVAKGIAEESSRYSHLIEVLLSANRQDDLKRAANDEAFRCQLFQELSID